MAQIPLGNATLLDTPTLHAHWKRYTLADFSNDPTAANPNLTGAAQNLKVGQLHRFLPAVLMQGEFFEVRGHILTSGTPDFRLGPDAESYLNDGLTPITAELGYVVESPASPPSTGPTRQVQLKNFANRRDIRDFSRDNLGRYYPEYEFQKKAMMDALWSHWEFMMINGDSSVSAAQIDGLAVLANTTGAGQSFAVTTGGDPLLDLDLAITKAFSNGGFADVIVGNEAALRKLAEFVRASGYKPDFRVCEQTGELALFYNGIPFCRSDHVKNVSTTVGSTTSLFIMALGEPNGVFAITSQDAPGIKFRETERSNPPFLSIRADLYAALVSTTDLALVELSGWPVSAPIFP